MKHYQSTNIALFIHDFLVKNRHFIFLYSHVYIMYSIKGAWVIGLTLHVAYSLLHKKIFNNFLLLK